MTLTSVIRPEAPAPATAAPRPDDATIVLAASQGDRVAFEKLVHLYHQRVLNFIHQMTRQRQDAEDLTQQTFVKAFLHINRVDPARPIINWLLTIARRTALNHFRSARRWEYVPAELASTEPSPSRQLEQQ